MTKKIIEILRVTFIDTTLHLSIGKRNESTLLDKKIFVMTTNSKIMMNVNHNVYDMNNVKKVYGVTADWRVKLTRENGCEFYFQVLKEKRKGIPKQ